MIPRPVRSRAAALAALLALSGCMTKEGQLREGLVQVGFSKPMAQCMAQPMAAKLSIAELKRLAILVKQVQNRPHDRFQIEINALQDPRIIAVTSEALLHCTFP